ncbi:MAG: hypothetical protein ACP5ME_15410 [Anaerolineae bacterium]
MDINIGQIAAAAAALLGPYLAKAGEALAKKAGEAAWAKVEALYQAIRRKFAADRDDYAQKTLQRLEEQPSSEARQAALADVLAEKAQADPAFARQLAALVGEAREDKALVQFITQVYGEAYVGKITNIGWADVVHIE